MLLKLPAVTFLLLDLRAGERLFAFHMYAEMWPLKLGSPVPSTVAGHVHQTAADCSSVPDNLGKMFAA